MCYLQMARVTKGIPMIFKSLTSGKTVQGKEIHAFIAQKKSSRYLYLLAGVHGDEIEGVHVLKNLFAWIKTQKNLDIPCVVIPALNLDGLELKSRVNANGVDLNRNFPTSDWSENYSEAKYHPGSAPLSEPENQYLVQLMKTYPPGLVISMHSWKPLLNYNGDCKNIADFLHQFNHYEVSDDVHYPTPGSFGTYAPAVHLSPVLTFEFPTLDYPPQYTLEQIWQQNETGLQALMQSALVDFS